MGFLVRKIMQSSSVNKLENLEKDHLESISSDVTTNEFRTSGSKLSVWYITTENELDNAALAIALGGQKLENFKLMLLESERVETFFTVNDSPGSTCIEELASSHRDICGITHESLINLLKLYKDAVDEEKCFRYRTKEIKDLVKVALKEKKVQIQDASEKLQKDLEDLLQST